MFFSVWCTNARGGDVEEEEEEHNAYTLNLTILRICICAPACMFLLNSIQVWLNILFVVLFKCFSSEGGRRTSQTFAYNVCVYLYSYVLFCMDLHGFYSDILQVL